MRLRVDASSVLVGSALLGALWVVWMPPAWLPAGTGAATSVVLVTIALLATGVVAEAVTILLFFLAAMLFAIAPASVVFSGFASSAFWIIFGGLILGMAIRHTGLGQALASALLQRLPGWYPLVIAGTVLVGLLLAFVMPGAMGRMVLLVPIAIAVAERLGFGEADNGRVAIVLGAIFGTHTGSFSILPSNTPNVVWSGAMESVHGLEIGYLDYLWWHFPVLGLLRSILLVALLVVIFPDQLRKRDEAPGSAADALTDDQRLLRWVLVVALGLWATDFIHGVGPAWVALGAAVGCLLAGQRLVPAKPLAALDMGPLVLVAGVLGLGAVVAELGMGEAAFNQLLPYLPLAAGADALNYAFVSLGGVGLAVLTTMPGVPAIGVPLGETLAESTGWSIESVMIVLAASYSTYLLPYQAPPILIGAQLGGIPWRSLVWFTFVFALLSIVVIFPFHYLWLLLIGVLG
ncbi:sodium/sulfate symporter [Spiribacter salinus M19-40]|uniref:Sodium/sulfate symporter n=1 Tax=Spiribacter salinus M19-40 TaxID=1260251 RepID=R4VML4_9GAMM|nr:SLC13 family permease [Spiribacter salinus]AGM40808.1 sodium/sulfate symporter [Spiribacter salinus M19-40]